MIDTLISSKTRIKLLLKFFLNSNTISYLRNLESEFGESSNGIRVELNKLENAGMLTSFLQGNKKMYKADTNHPLFNEIHNILLKQIGLNRLIEHVIERLGNVEQVFLVGKFSQGLDSDIIDLIFVGDIDKIYVLKLVEKVEKKINRKVRYLIYRKSEIENFDIEKFSPKPFLLWSKI